MHHSDSGADYNHDDDDDDDDRNCDCVGDVMTSVLQWLPQWSLLFSLQCAKPPGNRCLL